MAVMFEARTGARDGGNLDPVEVDCVEVGEGGEGGLGEWGRVHC